MPVLNVPENRTVDVTTEAQNATDEIPERRRGERDFERTKHRDRDSDLLLHAQPRFGPLTVESRALVGTVTGTSADVALVGEVT